MLHGACNYHKTSCSFEPYSTTMPPNRTVECGRCTATQNLQIKPTPAIFPAMHEVKQCVKQNVRCMRLAQMPDHSLIL